MYFLLLSYDKLFLNFNHFSYLKLIIYLSTKFFLLLPS